MQNQQEQQQFQKYAYSNAFNLAKKKLLMVVYGLPCSGKTTFSKQLRLTIEKFFSLQDKSSQNSRLLLIHGDQIEYEYEYLKKQRSELLQTIQNYNLNHRKNNQEQQITKKNEDIKGVNKTIQQLFNLFASVQINSKNHNEKKQFDPEKWKSSRKFMEKSVDYLFRYSDITLHIILQDDFLYRSQRKIYQKISWLYNLPYLQIFMDTTIEQCIHNLNNRLQTNNTPRLYEIDKSVIIKASQKLEVIEKQKFLLKLSFQERNKQSSRYCPPDLLKKLSIIEIFPNDPNDQSFLSQECHNKKAKSQQTFFHSRQEQIEIAIRRFIGEIMKKGLKQVIGTQLLKYQEKNGQFRQKLGKDLAKWKKNYAKYPERSKSFDKMSKHLLNWIASSQN